MTDSDFALLETDAGFPIGSKWAISNPPTTQFHIVKSNCNKAQEIIQNIANITLCEIKGEQVDLSNACWAIRCQCERLPVPFMCWIENDQTDTLIFETMLHPADPLGHHADLINILFNAFPHAKGIADLGCNAWYSNEELQRELERSLPPNPDFLFCIESIQENNAKEATFHLRTIGLERASRPELNARKVPKAYADEMASVLAEIAALSLENPLSEPGKRYSVANNIFVLINIDPEYQSKNIKHDKRHPQALLEDLDGSSWPHSLMSAIHKNTSGVWRSQYLSKRIQAAARQSWNLFLEASNAINLNSIISVPWSNPDNKKKSEHIWFEVTKIDGKKVLALPIHKPALAIIPKEEQVFEMNDISDWRIESPVGLLGPFDIESIKEIISLSK